MSATNKKMKLNISKLSSLASISVAPEKEIGEKDIPLNQIIVKPQVRKKIGDLSDLRRSIKAKGIQQRLWVHDIGGGKYELIAGERRYLSSEAEGFTTVPVKIYKNLTPIEFRQLQILENNDHTPLTSYDEAIGVAKDVEEHGFAMALEIWNRNESWISKRAGVFKFNPSVLSLFKDGYTDDLELLHSLNILLSVDNEEANHIIQRFLAKDDPAPHRDEIRLKVSRAKSLKKEDRQKATALPTSLVVESSETNTSTSDSVSDTVLEDQPKADTDPKPAVKGPGALKVKGKETKKDVPEAS